MILSFHPCFDADIQMILGDQVLGPDHAEKIEGADAIILPQACTQNLYEACAHSEASVFPNYAARIQYPGKMGQHRLFEAFRLRCPRTHTWSSADHFKAEWDRANKLPHSFPFLFKEDRRHEGEGIFFVENPSGLKGALTQLEIREKSGVSGCVSQDYVDCEGNALRVVIVGDRVITYWKRPRDPQQPITTISRGARIDHQWKPALQQKGEIQARRLSAQAGINLAAVDFIFPDNDPDPEPLFLEINYYFGRRGLGGSETYYRLLYEAIREWLNGCGLAPDAVRLV
mgnify:CR=1 FL=1